MKERTDPANIPPWADGQFVGRARDRARAASRIMWMRASTASSSTTATPGVPRRHRQAWLGRFADEVAPYASAGGETLRAAASA